MSRKKNQSGAKPKKGRNVFYNIIIIILIGVIAYCGYHIGTALYDYHKGTVAYEKIADLAGAEDGKMEIDWDKLLAENGDIKAWIYSKDTVINYPIVQGKNNSQYLRHLINGEWDMKGTLFFDAGCQEPLEQFNTILYGHNLMDGSMFNSLMDYRNKDGYYAKHKKMEIYTPTKKYDLEIIGATKLEADSHMYNMNLYSDEEKQSYINWIYEHNEIPGNPTKDIQVTPSDRLVMMSTCTNVAEDERVVVWGRLLEK